MGQSIGPTTAIMLIVAATAVYAADNATDTPAPGLQEIQPDFASPVIEISDHGRFGKCAGMTGDWMKHRPLLLKEKRPNALVFAADRFAFPEKNGSLAFWIKGPNLHCVYPFRCEPYSLAVWPHPYAFTSTMRTMEIQYIPRTNIWTHLLLTWTSPETGGYKSRCQLYVNGEKGRSGRSKEGLAERAAEMLLMERLHNGTFIDEVILSSKVFSEVDARKLFFGGIYKPDEDTCFYLNFDDGTFNARARTR